MTKLEPGQMLGFLVAGLAARVLGRHFALRPPGCRDARLSRELLAIVRDAGREPLAEQLQQGAHKDREARQTSHEARVLSASKDIARVGAVRTRILKPQDPLTRRPELLHRLAATLEDAHEIARMVRDYHVPRPSNLPDDGSLLRRAASLRTVADEIQAKRGETDVADLLAAIAAELDDAAETAEAFPPSVERALALERCFEAALQISSIVRSRGDQESIVHFSTVLERLVKFNQAIGMRAAMEKAKR